MKKIVTMLACLFLAQAVFSQTRPTPEKVKELMQLTGAANLGIQMMNNMIVEFRKLAPHVDSTFWQDFMKEVDVDEMENMVIPVYQQHFTAADVDGLIAFYRSELGRKMVSKLPLVTQECYKIGQQYGEKLGKRVVERLKAEGIDLKKEGAPL
ncbi:DUF2059 domain-containing protein [Chitinophaga sp. GCM10012297]|uniref:DUF2059 domain-containing protein n=1 Tax=Chitinophaga chungangae TaxID=2821488 RepID=A0ABS3YFJ0_9BACT|nr:DUF2059 domain-containing protein [Chitinophaga chungangae]MBO9153438.1 DUF2059 domain-containing protein [Chitinophaga chungangae]